VDAAVVAAALEAVDRSEDTISRLPGVSTAVSPAVEPEVSVKIRETAPGQWKVVGPDMSSALAGAQKLLGDVEVLDGERKSGLLGVGKKVVLTVARAQVADAAEQNATPSWTQIAAGLTDGSSVQDMPELKAEIAPAPAAAAAVSVPAVREPEPSASRVLSGADLGQVMTVPVWSRMALRDVGLPPAVMRRLPAEDPRTAAEWDVALTRIVAETLELVGAPNPDIVVTGRGTRGAGALLAAAAAGLPLSALEIEGVEGPVTTSRVMEAIRNALPRTEITGTGVFSSEDISVALSLLAAMRANAGDMIAAEVLVPPARARKPRQPAAAKTSAPKTSASAVPTKAAPRKTAAVKAAPRKTAAVKAAEGKSAAGAARPSSGSGSRASRPSASRSSGAGVRVVSEDSGS